MVQVSILRVIDECVDVNVYVQAKGTKVFRRYTQDISNLEISLTNELPLQWGVYLSIPI